MDKEEEQTSRTDPGLLTVMEEKTSQNPGIQDYSWNHSPDASWQKNLNIRPFNLPAATTAYNLVLIQHGESAQNLENSFSIN
ncbi:hypothetical protein A6R68_17326 [Neotoma lepida]|uniref:Uncharacterized protein n=1 Tax=Neotoma lepida TaxID=56216 RepID=A0A1A6HCC4_NEOLE|nr:hypothetical protein A6R68_17326 [Neotoma lepida]